MHFIMTKWQNTNEIFFLGGWRFLKVEKGDCRKSFLSFVSANSFFELNPFPPLKLSNRVRDHQSKSIYKSSKEFSIWQFDHLTIFKIRRLEVDPVVLARDLDEVQTSSWKFWKTFFESVCSTLMARLNY